MKAHGWETERERERGVSQVVRTTLQRLKMYLNAPIKAKSKEERMKRTNTRTLEAKENAGES